LHELPIIIARSAVRKAVFFKTTVERSTKNGTGLIEERTTSRWLGCIGISLAKFGFIFIQLKLTPLLPTEV
jgi:hypothetical protein